MAKDRKVFSCSKCGAQHPKWSGQCQECGGWNTLEEETFQPVNSNSSVMAPVGYAGSKAELTKMQDVVLSQAPRLSSESSEFDRVLGGGLVAGSIVMVGGDPGVGKSTLLLQTLCRLSESQPVLYVTGEESLSQVTMRAKRLSLASDELNLLCETKVESVVATANAHKPKVIVIDSISESPITYE